ncbi:YciI family protein [Motilibacter rhizosphaerae]|nr:YciI family protein [Motilibacter rhizosphaerae]
MLLMFGSAGEMMATQPGDWVREMIDFMIAIDEELRASGELVEARGLADEARVVSLQDGQVVVSDGPYAESKEALAGYWVLDVASEERVVEIAGRIARWSGRVELRRVADGPPDID